MASDKAVALLRSLGRHGLALALFWLLGFALVQLGEHQLGGGVAPDLGLLLACVVGAGLAARLRAPLALYFLAASAAVVASELAIHLYFGYSAAQGAPTHLAVFGAGILGVAAGAWLARTSAGPKAPVEMPQEPGSASRQSPRLLSA